MTIKELIEELQKHDQDMSVFVDVDGCAMLAGKVEVILNPYLNQLHDTRKEVVIIYWD